jgi:alkanesulfonate monooxygenase SsuD/methylene tetrahydromethanopterin reductase-like flavin-dependent oxidoreductase (luciferase family)
VEGRRIVKAGLTLPQGCDREYLGVDPVTAWRRTVEVAQRAEELGFESLWAYDHMQVDPPPEEAIVFDPYVELAALAVETSRARLGHLVSAAAYRNAGLTA